MSKVKSDCDLKLCSDEELMLLYQNDNLIAFEILFRRHSGRVFSYLSQKIPRESAQELVQDVFEKLHKSRKQYRSDYPLLPWVFTIARNSLIDWYKKSENKLSQRTVTDLILIDNMTSGNEKTFHEEFDFTTAMQGLPAEQRKAIEMRYLHDWSFAQIAEALSTSEVNSRQLVSRGLQKLKDMFKNRRSAL